MESKKFKVGDVFIVTKVDGWPQEFLGVEGEIVGSTNFDTFECRTFKPVPNWRHGCIFTVSPKEAARSFEHHIITDSPLYKALK